MVEYTCDNCGEAFKRRPSAARGKTIFCSRQCAGQYIRNRVTFACEYCGKTFERPPSLIRPKDSQYCSKVCADRGKVKREKYKCDRCGIVVMRRPKYQEKYKHIFCSSECTHEYRRSHPEEFYSNLQVVVECATCGKSFKRKPSRLNFKNYYCSKECEYKGMVTRQVIICDFCGNEFEKTLSQIQRSRRHFCSYKCSRKYLAGENHYNWRGGKSSEPYGIAFNNKLKEYVRSRDDYTCQECGITELQLGRNLTCHHIDYDKQNNAPDANLISLCISCHGKTITNRTYWMPYFQGILVGRKYENAKQLLFPFAEVG